MRIRFFCLFLIIVLLATPLSVNAQETTVTVDVPVTINISEATGVNINIRLNPELVETAELVSPVEAIASSVYVCNQDEDKVKVAIASATPLTVDGVAFYLRLTLKRQATDNDELCKILQLKVNEKIVFQAENCILISGVKDGGYYTNPVTVHYNEGTATLDGEDFTSGTLVSETGCHTLNITDLNGNLRTISFTVGIPEKITSDVSCVRERTIVSDFLASLKEGAFCKIYSGKEPVSEDSFVATGMELRLINGDITLDTASVVVLGDVTGDGKISAADYMKMKRSIAKPELITGLYFSAGDINGDGAIKAPDYMKVKRYIAGSYDLYQ